MNFDLSALRELPTPSLVLDADALRRNIERMNSFLEKNDTFARPHTKTHKCVEIARLQMSQSRTVGICCARVAEAEAMVGGGLGRVLVTSPLVTSEKIRRFVDLAVREPAVHTVVDSSLGVERLEAEAARRGIRCGVVLDLDPGFHRTGVPMGAEAVQLAQRVLSADHLSLVGVQMYAGNLMHLEDAAERSTRSAALWQEVDATVAQIRALASSAGEAECAVITGGGTGTFDIDAASSIPSDLQVGSYVFMDAQYRVIHSDASEGSAAPFDFFEPSLFVVAAAVSQSVPYLITVDAGFKALSCDHAPEVAGFTGMRFHFAGDEHGMIQMGKPDAPLPAPSSIRLGDRVGLLVSHCDPTVNLHDHYVVLRNGVPAEEWKIAARGVP